MDRLLLFDLDNTLLANDMATFLPAYFQSLQEAFPGLDRDRLFSALAAGTQAALANQSPDRLLETAFDEVFYPLLGIRKADYEAQIERYYRESYPEIQSKTRPIPGAVQVVSEASAAGFRLAVATNPLFPATAILQRLHWAGFPEPAEIFELVTTMEDMHFAKPSPAYYAEILARMGWPQGPAVMVGDDAINDIQGAKALGLATYQVIDPVDGSSAHVRHGSGALGEILEWLAMAPAEDRMPDFAAPAAVLAILRSTLAVLHFWLINGGAVWDWQAEEGGWSFREIVCHLRDVEREGFAARLDLFAGEEEPFLPGLDTESWYESRDYSSASGEAAFDDFMALRKETIRRLDALQPQDWEKPARHAIFGPTDFLESMWFMAGHDQVHVRQIAEIMKTAPKGRIE